MSRFNRSRLAAAIAALAAPLVAAAAQTGEMQRPRPPVTQMIVKFRPAATGMMTPEMNGDRRAVSQARIQSVIQASGQQLSYRRAMSGHAHVLALPRPMSEEEAADTARAISQLPDVEYAEPDQWMSIEATPNDPYFVLNYQWNLQDPSLGAPNYVGAANLPDAWEISSGSGVTVAVIDTGVLNHPDLKARLIGGTSTAAGYDMISYASAANSGRMGSNDGNGRDSNPTDPGDWTVAGTCSRGWPATRSSWHGTHVAGTIAAVSNNSKGIAGIAPSARILAVRALGSCGGYLSDIADGIVWASGGAVSGVPSNTHPAKVINLSLGGSGACGKTSQDAINAAVSRGATVVVAAGNEDTAVANSSPANCNNVITVAAVGPTGTRAYYSNYDSGTSYIALAAPGGNSRYASPGGMILSTHNSGTTVASSSTYAWMEGTSMATPHVSGIVALMLASNPHLTNGDIPRNTVPALIKSRLQATARAFPVGGTCDTSNCGAGMVDAAEAVASVGTPPAVTAKVNGLDEVLVVPGTVVNLTSSASDNNVAPTHVWSQSGSGVGTFGDSAAFDTTFTTPASDAMVTVSFTATDDLLLATTKSLIIRVHTTGPADPAGLTATAASNGHIVLAWTDNSNNEDEFRIYRDSGSGSVLHATVAANTTTYSDASVTAGTTYSYYVIAYNGYSSGATASASATAVQARDNSGGGGGGGGGGALEWLSLLLGAFLVRRRL